MKFFILIFSLAVFNTTYSQNQRATKTNQTGQLTDHLGNEITFNCKVECDSTMNSLYNCENYKEKRNHNIHRFKVRPSGDKIRLHSNEFPFFGKIFFPDDVRFYHSRYNSSLNPNYTVMIPKGTYNIGRRAAEVELKTLR